jgi:hypothetical protein
MLREKRTAINVGIAVGLLLQGTGNYLRLHPHILGTKDTGIAVPWVVLAVGLAVYVYGCANYALAKGRTAWFGLAGMLNIFELMTKQVGQIGSQILFSILGLIALICLPDEYPTGSRTDGPDDVAHEA